MRAPSVRAFAAVRAFVAARAFAGAGALAIALLAAGLPPLAVAAPDDLPTPPRRPPLIERGPAPRAADPAPKEGTSPKVETPKAEAPKPRLDLTNPADRQKALVDLFERLAKAQDADEARGVAGAIERLWQRSGSDTADLLMDRVQQAMRKKNFKLAINLLDRMTALEPDWAEVWRQRASAKYNDDDADGAVADLAETLKREPRHFGALTGLGYIFKRAGLDKEALQVFRKTLDVFPLQDDVKRAVDELKPTVEGRDI